MATYATKETFYTTLDKVLATLNQDEKFTTRIAKADVSIGFKITDLEAEYTITICKGQVSGEIGGADAATIGVSCSAETFDKLLSAKMSGESAYMSGAIRLRGNEWTAESAASYLYYFAPTYKAITAEV